MKTRSLTALLLVIVLLLCGCSKTTKEKTPENGSAQPGIVMKSEHCTITDAMFEYMFFFNFYNTYGNDTEYYNLNLDLTFTEQLYEKNVTWQQHLTELTIKNAKNDIFLVEEGLANGFEYPELESQIDKNINEWKKSSENLQMTFEEYMVSYYGANANEEVLRNGLEIQLYASAYGEYLKDNFRKELDENDYTEYYKENKMNIEIVDVLVYSIPINYNGVINTEKRDSLLACKTEEEFKAWIVNDIVENNKNLENPKTEEQIQERISKACTPVMSYYTQGGSFSEWAFAKDTEIGDTHYTEQNTGMYEIYMLLKKPYAQEKYTHNIYQILITNENYSTAEEASAKADEILEELKANNCTTEAFEKLANEYNEDIKYFHENVANDFFPEDEMNEWLNSDQRKEGDTTVQLSSYGYHIILYAGKGMQKWKAEACEEMADNFITEKLAELDKELSSSLNFDESCADKLPNMIPNSAANIINEYGN